MIIMGEFYQIEVWDKELKYWKDLNFDNSSYNKEDIRKAYNNIIKANPFRKFRIKKTVVTYMDITNLQPE